MEDVIFAGTRDRKAVGMASVSLSLVDPNPAPLVAPVIVEHAEGEQANGQSNGHSNGHQNGHTNGNGHAKAAKPREVTITRRLYRSGESEYLINGEKARLRDIQDLFMGTGLGPESYAIIEQGRITQILSNKPQERRAVIEEAAGVSRFKTRRRLAEAKLEGAKQNLSRVFDILEEVGRQVNSLKRQAAKAKRYEELKTEMVGFLRRALAGRFKVREREAAFQQRHGFPSDTLGGTGYLAELQKSTDPQDETRIDAALALAAPMEIGRASCRERVSSPV